MKGKDYYLKHHCEKLLLLDGPSLRKILDKKKIRFDEIITSLGDRIFDVFKHLLPKINEQGLLSGHYASLKASQSLQQKIPELITTEVNRTTDGRPYTQYMRDLLSLFSVPLAELEDEKAQQILLALSDDLFRFLLLESNCKLLNEATSVQLFLPPNGVTDSLFTRTSSDPAFYSFWQKRFREMSDESFSTLFRGERKPLNLVEHLLSGHQWHDVLFNYSFYQHLPWHDMNSEHLYDLIQTQAGRKTLLADNAKVLRLLPIDIMTPRFIVMLLEELDKSKSLQDYLLEDTSPLRQKLMTSFDDTNVLNTSIEYNVSTSERDESQVRLASPLFQLAKSRFGRKLLLSYPDTLIDSISAKALTMGNHQGETPLFYFMDEPEILAVLLKDEGHFGEWNRAILFSDVHSPDKPKISLADKLMTRSMGIRILCANDLSGLRTLCRSDKTDVLSHLSHDKLKPILAQRITSASSFKTVTDFLEEFQWLHWLKASAFQLSLINLFAHDLDGLMALPQKHKKSFFNALQPDVLKESLINAMTDMKSFKKVIDLLAAYNRMDWLRQANFQKAIGSVFIALLLANDIPPDEDDIRLFTQHMGPIAFNVMNSHGQSVLSCLCRMKAGVKLIKEERFYQLLENETLDKPIHRSGGISKTLRTLLQESCGLVFQLNEEVSSLRFF